MATMINCPYCGKLTDPQLDSCVHCGGFLKKQSGGPQRKTSAASQTCPSCGALVRDGDIICVACGTNLLTGQKIAEERKKAVTSESRNPMTMIISVIAVVLIVLLGIIAIIYFTRDPVARAQKLDSAGRTTEAISLLEVHVSKKPEDSRAQFALGRLYFGMGDFQPAAQAFEAALETDLDNRQAGMFAIISYGELGGDANRNSQIIVLERMTQHDPSDAEALHILGLARGTLGDHLGQVDALKRSAEFAPTDPELEADLGVGLALDKQYPVAEEQLRSALANNPDNGDILAAMGHLSGLRGNEAEASDQLRAAVNEGTSLENEALTRLGLLSMKQGKMPEARVFFSQAKDNGADDPVANYFHAICLAEQGLSSGAIEAFEILSQSSNPFATKAAVQLARIQMQNQEPDRALEALNRVTVNLEGTDCAEFQTVRGRVFVALADVDSAMEAFRTAGKCDPNYPPVHLENGLLQVQRGNLSEGIRELQRYLDLVDTDDPGAGVSEVQGLVDQLKQSAQSETPATSASVSPGTEGGLS